LKKAAASIRDFFQEQAVVFEEEPKFYENLVSQLDAIQKDFAARVLSVGRKFEESKGMAKEWEECLAQEWEE
jgi:hypothetical protein